MKRIISALLMAAILMSAVVTSAVDVRAVSSTSSAGKVATLSSALNVRSTASTGSAVLSSLSRGSFVTLLEKSGSWWHVEYGNNQFGWCSASYISTVSSKVRYVNTNSGSLNVRSGAGTSKSIVGSLEKGKAVVELSTSSDWSKILYNGVSQGYVKSSYLSDTVSQGKYPSVRLTVSAYKQTDSRWASVSLGSSYETIGSAGCTTTCLAMSESYRTKKTVYPNEMQSRLSYSSSGSLYWPTNYVTSTEASGWLETVYSLLKSGKPVIVGSKKSSGSQHWVLVTGYAGNTQTLSPSGFVINDPATASRKVLSELLSDYPIFMKLAYYS